MSNKGRSSVMQALQYLIKSYRIKTQIPGWEKDTTKFNEMVEQALNLTQGQSFATTFFANSFYNPRANSFSFGISPMKCAVFETFTAFKCKCVKRRPVVKSI